jgi:hypothetical protein
LGRGRERHPVGKVANEKIAYPEKQLLGIERLGDIIVGAEAESNQPVFTVFSSCRYDDRDR